ncbi:MAG TPA: glycosyltransferase, partial [Acidobacteriota bacterium]|nr:glycosyltransferase [Acidobacteriota bacterium]
LKAAGGDLIAFLDQDDMWLPDKLEAQVNALKSKSGVGLVFCHYTAVDESLRPLPEQRRSRRSVRNPLKKMVSGCFIRTPSTVLAKTRAVKECGMFDESVIGASDWDFYLRLARRYAFMAIPEPLVLYRMHQKQFHRDTAVMRSAAMRVMDKTLEWARSDRPDLRNHVERSYGRILRKAGRSQLVDECDSIRALDTLRKARKMRPWDILIHGLIMAAKFRRHRRTEGVK